MKKHLVRYNYGTHEQAHQMAEELLSLFAELSRLQAPRRTLSLELTDDNALERLNDSNTNLDGHHVQFDDLAFNIVEAGIYKARVQRCYAPKTIFYFPLVFLFFSFLFHSFLF